MPSGFVDCVLIFAPQTNCASLIKKATSKGAPELYVVNG